MGVALIAWGRFFDKQGNKVTVPAPTTEPEAPWLLDFLKEQAPRLRRVGFTAIQLPPTSKAAGGAGAGCDGYGVYDPRDIGSKPQQGSTATRYGSRQSLLQFIAAAHANGMQVYLDLVLHQRMGENAGPGVFKYLGADGKTLSGRGQTSPSWFRGVPPDNLPDDDVPNKFFDYAFGRELSYQHCEPPRVTIEDALDYGDWVFRTTGADGARFDDVKGTWAPFVHEFMTSRAMTSKFFYSEYFEGNPDTLDWWANSVPMNGRSLVEDFTLHWALQEACNNGHAEILNGSGYTARHPMQAVTFIDNPDTDTSKGQQIISNKLLAYAFLLTIEGYPFVYGKDYFDDKVWTGAYGLHTWIDRLVMIHEHMANGGTVTRYLDDKVIVLNRIGSPGLLTAINFDTWNKRTITCDTSFPPNTDLHDYTARHPDIQTDPYGRVTFTIPSNEYNNGQSYLCFSRPGIDLTSHGSAKTTTQTILGSWDLDIKPVLNQTVEIGKIEIKEGTTLEAEIRLDRNGWPPSAEANLTVIGPNNHQILNQRCLDPLTRATTLESKGGTHTIEISGTFLPENGTNFEVTLTYMAPHG